LSGILAEWQDILYIPGSDLQASNQCQVRPLNSDISERHGQANLETTAGASSLTHGIEDRPALVKAYYRSQHVARAFEASVCNSQASHWTFEMLRFPWKFTSPARDGAETHAPHFFLDIPCRTGRINIY
jgi:hypothetical protein